MAKKKRDRPERRTGRPNGRPTRLTKQRRDDALVLFGSAMPQASIAACIGVTSSTLRHWLTEGRRANDDYADKGIPVPKDRKAWAEFSAEAYRAKAMFIASRLTNVAAAGDAGEWKADAWLLKVMDREVFGDRQHIEAEVSTNVVTLYPVDSGSMSTTLVLPEGAE